MFHFLNLYFFFVAVLTSSVVPLLPSDLHGTLQGVSWLYPGCILVTFQNVVEAIYTVTIFFLDIGVL